MFFPTVNFPTLRFQAGSKTVNVAVSLYGFLLNTRWQQPAFVSSPHVHNFQISRRAYIQGCQQPRKPGIMREFQKYT